MLKVVSNKLAKTQKKTSLQWSKYREKKARIKSRKSLTLTEKKQILTSELELTRKKISEDFLQYREFKHAKIYKSPYSDFSFTKQIKTPKTIQKIYKAKRGFDTDKLDDLIPNVLYQKDVTGVLIVFEVENEQGVKSYVSNYLSKDLLERIEENEESIFDYVTERINAGYIERLKLRFIYMRIIYANPKKSNN